MLTSAHFAHPLSGMGTIGSSLTKAHGSSNISHYSLPRHISYKERLSLILNSFAQFLMPKSIPWSLSLHAGSLQHIWMCNFLWWPQVQAETSSTTSGVYCFSSSKPSRVSYDTSLSQPEWWLLPASTKNYRQVHQKPRVCSMSPA